MKELLLSLEELQRHDVVLSEREAGLTTLPQKLAALHADLARMEELLGAERRGLVEAEGLRRTRELELKSNEAGVAKSKTKLQQVKNAREYMAAQREIESTRKVIADREEEILGLLTAIETAKKSIAAHAEDVESLRTHVATEETAILARMAELRDATAAERAVRDEVASRVPADMLKRYLAVRARRGVAVVAMKNGVCLGCHMAVPAQLAIAIQRATGVENCPHCHRIIYWDKLLEPVELERGEQAPPSPTPGA